VFVGGGDPKVPRGLPVSLTSALIKRRGSCPPLPLVEIRPKASTGAPVINVSPASPTTSVPPWRMRALDLIHTFLCNRRLSLLSLSLIHSNTPLQRSICRTNHLTFAVARGFDLVDPWLLGRRHVCAGVLPGWFAIASCVFERKQSLAPPPPPPPPPPTHHHSFIPL